MNEGCSASPLVSVVIPTYDVRDFVRSTLNSVLAQTYRPLELIVADDGSPDDTCQVVAAWDSRDVPLELIRLHHTGNPALPRNTALGRVRGELIAYLDADDICEPTRIAESVAALALAGPEVHFAFTSYSTIDAAGRAFEGRTLAKYDRLNTVPRQALAEGVYRLPGREVHDALLGSSFIRPSQVVVRTEFVRRSRGFDETLHNAHDLDLFLEMLRSTDAVWVDQPLVHYRQRAGNMTSRGLLNMAPSRIAVLERHVRHAYSDYGRRGATQRLADVYDSLGWACRTAGRYGDSAAAYWKEFRLRRDAKPIVGLAKTAVAAMVPGLRKARSN
jgi:glycosyltransferase involved in cell wall biosynthesis